MAPNNRRLLSVNVDHYNDSLAIDRLGLSEYLRSKLRSQGVVYIADFFDIPPERWVKLLGDDDANRVTGYLRSVARHDHVLKDDLTPAEKKQEKKMHARQARARVAAEARKQEEDAARVEREERMDRERMLGR